MFESNDMMRFRSTISAWLTLILAGLSVAGCGGDGTKITDHKIVEYLSEDDSTTDDGHFVDSYWFKGLEDGTATANIDSSAFDPVLEVYDEDGRRILRNDDGDLRLCDANGGDYPSQVPIEYADAANPIRHLTNGRMGWDCDGKRLEAFNVTRWFSVTPAVANVGLRFVVDGAAGPWFSADAKNGFVHVHGWLDEQQADTAVHLQVRVLDAQGNNVPQTEIATAPQPVMACDGSSVEIL